MNWKASSRNRLAQASKLGLMSVLLQASLINAGFMSSRAWYRCSSRSDESFTPAPSLSPITCHKRAPLRKKNLHRQCPSGISLRENLKRGCAWYFHAWIIGISCSMRRAETFYRAVSRYALDSQRTSRDEELEERRFRAISAGTCVTWRLDADDVSRGTLCFLQTTLRDNMGCDIVLQLVDFCWSLSLAEGVMMEKIGRITIVNVMWINLNIEIQTFGLLVFYRSQFEDFEDYQELDTFPLEIYLHFLKPQKLLKTSTNNRFKLIFMYLCWNLKLKICTECI